MTSADEDQGGRVFFSSTGRSLEGEDEIVVLSGGTKAADGAPVEALSAPIVARVWGVPARWLGEPGARALIAG